MLYFSSLDVEWAIEQEPAGPHGDCVKGQTYHGRNGEMGSEQNAVTALIARLKATEREKDILKEELTRVVKDMETLRYEDKNSLLCFCLMLVLLGSSCPYFLVCLHFSSVLFIWRSKNFVFVINTSVL